MNTDRLLLVFGSAVTSDSPRDVDVVCEGEFGAVERALVATWVRDRGLQADLPLDVKDFGKYGVSRRAADKRAYVDLPTPYLVDDRRNGFVVLRGDIDVSWYQVHALPARIRAASDVFHLLHELRTAERFPDGRMAVLGTFAESVRDFCSYTQGRVALQNAIAKCPFWEMAELHDPRVRYVRWLAEYGVADSAAHEINAGGQAGGGDGAVNYVTLDGIQLCYGRLAPWREALPLKRIRRQLARANGRRRAVSVPCF